MSIYYLPRKNTYHITGKVRVCYPNGKTAVVADTEIKDPGPRRQITPRMDRWDEMRRCRGMAGG